MSRPEHEIFKGPFPVDLTLTETPTPKHYFTFPAYPKVDVPETLPTLTMLIRARNEGKEAALKGRFGDKTAKLINEAMEDQDQEAMKELQSDAEKFKEIMDFLREISKDEPQPGLVSTDLGFFDSPDTESIAGGIHAKGLNYIAIGRQANFLLWGFNGSPDEMTEPAKAIFANAVAFIAKFADEDVEVLRKTTPRQSFAGSLDSLDRYATMPDGEQLKSRMLGHFFGDSVPDAITASEQGRRSWISENLPYIRYEPKKVKVVMDGREFEQDDGRFEIDEDAKALGIGNNNIALLERCVSDLESRKDVARAKRLLERYTGITQPDDTAWRKWLEESRGEIYFTDWGGYIFRVKGDRRIKQEINDAVPDKKVVTPTLVLEQAEEGVVGRLKIEVSPGYHLYAPGSSEGIAVSVQTYSKSSYRVSGEPRFPSSDGHLAGSFEVEVPLQGEGPFATVELIYQACDAMSCLMPTSIVVGGMVKEPATAGAESK